MNKCPMYKMLCVTTISQSTLYIVFNIAKVGGPHKATSVVSRKVRAQSWVECTKQMWSEVCRKKSRLPGSRRTSGVVHLSFSSHFHRTNMAGIVHCSSGSRGGGRGFNPPPLQRLFLFFFACQYMKIPTDLDPKPPLRRILAQNPPPPLKNS